MESKTCNKCGVAKPFDDFPKRAYKKPGVRGICKECVAKYAHRRYMKDPQKFNDACWRSVNKNRDVARTRWRKAYHENPEKFRKKYRDAREKNPEKYKAHDALNYAIKRGDIARPTECSECSRDDLRIIGHHDSYAEDKRLAVRWLCESCHGFHHFRRKEKQ